MSGRLNLNISIFIRREFYVTLALMMFLILPVSVNAAPGWLTDLETKCNAGQADGCLSAGAAYLRGEYDSKKVAKDKRKANMFIKDGLQQGERNCKRNSLHDCYIIGVVYFEGHLTPADFSKGLQLLQKSCKGGYKEACIWLENSGIRM